MRRVPPTMLLRLRKPLCAFFVGSFVLLVVACGGGKGDSCSEEGKVLGECDEGLVCGRQNNDQTGELVCLQQCNTVVNCGGDEDCYGVANTSLKGCRKK